MILLHKLMVWFCRKLIFLAVIAVLFTLGWLALEYYNDQRAPEIALAELYMEKSTMQKDLLKKQEDKQQADTNYQLKLANSNFFVRWLRILLAKLIVPKEIRDALKLVREAEARLADIDERIEATMGQIEQTQLSKFKRFVSSQKLMGTALLVVFLVFFGSMLHKLLWYYGLAAWTAKANPIQVIAEEAPVEPSVGAGAKNLEVVLEPGVRLFSRMDAVKQYDHESTEKRTRYLYDWRAPLISCASGMLELTEWWVQNGSKAVRIPLSWGKNPDMFVAAIDLQDHPGVVLRPGQVVALTSGVRMKTRWCLGNLHSWISGRLRHIVFYGTGTVFVGGCGGVQAVSNGGIRVEESAVIGFSAQMPLSTVRTATFHPFLKNQASLYDLQFSGTGTVIQHLVVPQDARLDKNPFMRFVDSVLGGVGKLFGL